MDFLDCLRDQAILTKHKFDHEKNRDNLIEIVTYAYGSKAKYIIFDPFNHTYNTAKNVERSNSEYPNCFCKALNSILENGKLEFDQK